MTEQITKGMILAAGLGTRLRPLTYKTPKPLVEVGGKPIITYNIELLKKSGIKDIMINLHHLGEQIADFLGDGSSYGVRLHYSREKDILGTGGGIKRVGDFFRGTKLLVINGDILTNINLPRFLEDAERAGLVLALRKLADNNAYTPLELTDNYVTALGRGKHHYTGIQIIDHALLNYIPEESFSDIVSDLYRPLLAEDQQIAAYTSNKYWNDIGTMEHLKQANNDVTSGGVKFWYI